MAFLVSASQLAAKLAMQKCKIFYIFLALIHKSADNTVFCGVGTGAGSACSRAIVPTWSGQLFSRTVLLRLMALNCGMKGFMAESTAALHRRPADLAPHRVANVVITPPRPSSLLTCPGPRVPVLFLYYTQGCLCHTYSNQQFCKSLFEFPMVSKGLPIVPYAAT